MLARFTLKDIPILLGGFVPLIRVSNVKSYAAYLLFNILLE